MQLVSELDSRLALLSLTFKWVIAEVLGFGFDRCAQAMLVVDENAETVCANSAAGNLFGVEPSWLIGRKSINMGATRYSTVHTDQETVAFGEDGLDDLERETTLVTSTGSILQAQICAV